MKATAKVTDGARSVFFSSSSLFQFAKCHSSHVKANWIHALFMYFQGSPWQRSKCQFLKYILMKCTHRSLLNNRLTRSTNLRALPHFKMSFGINKINKQKLNTRGLTLVSVNTDPWMWYKLKTQTPHRLKWIFFFNPGKRENWHERKVKKPVTIAI